MKFALLIHEEDAKFATMPAADHEALMEEYRAFMREMQAAGVFVTATRLRAVSDAATVRVRDRQVLVTDGPFAETKEQFGGFVVIDVASRDEALRWAAKAPSARVGSIEVRPIWTSG